MSESFNKMRSFSRREFIGTAARATAATAAMPLMGIGLSRGAPPKKRLALVGTGVRGTGCWGQDLIRDYSDYMEFVGLCDANPLRVAFAKKYLGVNCPTYEAKDFDRMIAETKPDAVVVTTMCSTHYIYTCRAMELGCDVITEKPLATDEKQAQKILDTEKRTGRKVKVTFNYRYGPDAVLIKEILRSGEIGEVVSVDYNYYLDTDHGASYFRRWHGLRSCSGTLLVHKATHHYDEMNWWLDSEPEEVFGYGRLVKYGSNGPFRGRRCMGCPHKDKCQFYWDITKEPLMMDLYVKCEEADGYIRDNCLYRHAIDIYDSMAVQARYANGVQMTYSLTAFMPYEGYRVCFNGLKGRLDVRVYHQTPWEAPYLAEARITKIFGGTEVKTIAAGGGGHWGADNVMKDMIFKQNVPDPLGQAAGSRAGAMSILLGIAARTSIDMKEPVKIHDLVDFG